MKRSNGYNDANNRTANARTPASVDLTESERTWRSESKIKQNVHAFVRRRRKRKEEKGVKGKVKKKKKQEV